MDDSHANEPAPLGDRGARPDDETLRSGDGGATGVPGAADATHADGPPRTATPPGLRRGSMIGRWVVLDRLGAGGMGVVYAAYDPELDRKVAIKLVTGTADDPSRSGGATRLLREAQSMARLSHPNVVTVFDVGAVDSGVYIAMELIEGDTLTAWLATRSRSRREILRVFEAAGRGIEAAHAAGLVHRDFKPDNVMVGRDGRVRVLDFGLARPARHAEAAGPGAMESSGGWSGASPLSLDLTVPGTVLGTPRYMAPEQFAGRPADERSDVYSFCVALWEAVYGVRPFVGRSLADLASRVIAGEIEEPPARAGVPRWLRAVLRRGMATQAAARFASMAELLGALDRDRVQRRRWTALGVGLGLVAVVGSVALHRASVTQLCRDADAALVGVWDEERKDAIAAAFVREGKSYTAASWRTVQRELDGYADAWVSMRREACEASRVHGTQSDDLLGRRMACLDRRLQRFAALTDALAEGGSPTILRAVESADALPDVAPCGDVERLGRGVAPPEDRQVRAEVEAIRLAMERAEGQGIAGEFDGLSAQIGELLERARATGYRPVVAEVLRLQGKLYGNLSRIDDARTVLNEALDVAEAVGHDPEIVEISTELLEIEASGRNDFEIAALHSRRAQAVLERMGGDPSLQVHLWKAQAGLHAVRDDDDEAIALLRRAVAKAAEIGWGGPRRLPMLNNLASALLGAERLDEVGAVLDEAQAIVDAELGPDHPNAAVLLTMQGRLRNEQGRVEESLALQQRARAVFVSSLGPEHRNVAALDNGIALALSGLGRDDEAERAYVESLAIMEKVNGSDHLSVAIALQNLVLLELRRGEGERARDHMLRVLAIRAPKLGPGHENIGFAKDLLGDAHLLVGEHAQAAAAYRDAIEIFGALGKPLQQAYGQMGLARVLLAEGKPAAALAQAEVALGLQSGDSTSAADKGRLRAVMVQALAATGGDAGEIDRLAGEAVGYLREAGVTSRRELAALEAWRLHRSGRAEG